MSQHSDGIVWFEIPASDFERATRFYETVFQVTLRREQYGDDNARMGVFPYQLPGVNGAVVEGAMYQPGATGSVVYFNAGADLAVPLARVEGAGGKVLVPKTLISPEIGYFAHIIDTEGNRVAMHSMN
ncbi:MAG TPA: VOC family protein [Azospirillaceae bacterium]|nr:VOC family protein [Azospirillaceae bacterium]